MRFKKILLLSPSYSGGHFGALRPPAGLGYLAQSLRANGYKLKVLDLAVIDGDDFLFETLKSFEPDLVGISLMSFMYLDSYETLRLIKKELPGVKVVAGGPHVSTLRQEIMVQCDDIDFGVVLDGEAPLLELCSGKDLEEIGGLIYRKDGKVLFNGERAIERNLDLHPYPKYEGFTLDKYVTEEIGIVTSRGCPFLCTYCPVGTSIGRKFRVRTPGSVVEELEHWYNRGYRQFSILDDVFNLDKKRVLAICQEIKNRGFKDIEINCNNGIRADRIDEDMLSAMYEAGFRYLAFGVEGGNDKILENIKKGESIKEVEEAIALAIKLNFKVTLFFIVGSPGETLKDVQDSIDLAKKYPVFDARFYNLIPFPASEFFDWINEKNYFIKDPEDYLNNSSQWDDVPVFVTPEFSADERKVAFKMVKDARKEIRCNSMKRALKDRLGPLAGPIAKAYVTDTFQDLLMNNGFLRKNLKKAFMKTTTKRT